MTTSSWKTGAAVAVIASAGALAFAPAAGAAKFVTITDSRGAGGSLGGEVLPIPDGAGEQTQLVRSGIPIKRLNPRGKIVDVNVQVRATHAQARDLEFYLATPRGVIALSSDNGGTGNDYGAGAPGCGGLETIFDSNATTLISTPGLSAPFLGSYAPEETLQILNGLGGKKASNSKWSLLVEDDSNQNPAGTLDCFGITIKATNPPDKAEPESD